MSSSLGVTEGRGPSDRRCRAQAENLRRQDTARVQSDAQRGATWQSSRGRQKSGSLMAANNKNANTSGLNS